MIIGLGCQQEHALTPSEIRTAARFVERRVEFVGLFERYNSTAPTLPPHHPVRRGAPPSSPPPHHPLVTWQVRGERLPFPRYVRWLSGFVRGRLRRATSEETTRRKHADVAARQRGRGCVCRRDAEIRRGHGGSQERRAELHAGSGTTTMRELVPWS